MPVKTKSNPAFQENGPDLYRLFASSTVSYLCLRCTNG